MSESFLRVPAIKVSQPLGDFFVASIKAKDLLELCYSAPAESVSSGMGVEGTQRLESGKRLREISEYIQTHEAAFPNSIILGANYDINANLITEELAWTAEKKGDIFELNIPTKSRIASIIDGQHRLMAFNNAPNKCGDIELLCSIYLDLPIPYHAYIFATINFNQKKVDKSLAYNLFGFDIEKSNASGWTPETMAVSFSRRLNIDANSPLRNAISLGVITNVERENDEPHLKRIKVSMATIVDGILKLISKNPKRDRTDIMKLSSDIRSRQVLPADGAPLRTLYIRGFDEAIYEVIRNYFIAVNEILWSSTEHESYIRKTVGIQALFDVLAVILKDFESKPEGEVDFFRKMLNPLNGMDFKDAQASGIGRTKIRNQILEKLRLK